MAFSYVIRKELSLEGGGLCSNPDCRAPHMQVDHGVNSGGDGAHIVSESLDGPRGNSSLEPELRGLASNGIWLCKECHYKVDRRNPERYSVQLLHAWKREAKAYFAAHEGVPLHALVFRGIRARPSVQSLNGAKRFLEFHSPLFGALKQLQWDSRGLRFGSTTILSSAVERLIRLRSYSDRTVGASWQNEWSTAYWCDNQELFNHMGDLIHYATEMLECVDPRAGDVTVDFSRPDFLAETIVNYIQAFEDFKATVQDLDGFGLRGRRDREATGSRF